VLECDLSGLVTEGMAIVEQFAPVGHYLRHWPGTVVLVHAPDSGVRSGLASAGYADRMVVHADWEFAGVEAHRLLPALRRTSMLLQPEPTAPAAARAFVAHTLQEWRLPSLMTSASQVLSELVTYATIGGDADLEVSLSRVDTRIRIATTSPVTDISAALSKLPEHPSTGRARQLVQEVVDGWGVIAGRPAGCTVWAVMDASRGYQPDEVAVSRREQAAGRHRGAADADVLTELHNRTLGRHRSRSPVAAGDHGDVGPDR
jgi:hypothetical protein